MRCWIPERGDISRADLAERVGQAEQEVRVVRVARAFRPAVAGRVASMMRAAAVRATRGFSRKR